MSDHIIKNPMRNSPQTQEPYEPNYLRFGFAPENAGARTHSAPKLPSVVVSTDPPPPLRRQEKTPDQKIKSLIDTEEGGFAVFVQNELAIIGDAATVKNYLFDLIHNESSTLSPEDIAVFKRCVVSLEVTIE